MERPDRAQYTKCSKKNPATCRLHKGQYAKFTKAMVAYRDSEQVAKEKVLVEKLQNDIKTNFKLKKLSDGTYEASVYRVGVPSPPVERGVEKEVYLTADKYVPAGRQGRTSAVFATPVMGVVGRWASQWNRIEDQQVRELRVNPDEVYVYSIRAWEKASSGFDYNPDNEALYRTYWNSGVTLSQWIRAADKGQILDPAEWELLIPEKSICKVSTPSIPKVLESQFVNTFRLDELKEFLTQNRKDVKILKERREQEALKV